MTSQPSFTREERRALERLNARQPVALVEIPAGDVEAGVTRMLRSRDFLVMVYSATDTEPERIAVMRTSLQPDGQRWKGNISWDDLQRLKREAGYGDVDALEVYPRDRDVVNVANVRHLWLMPDGIDFAWRASTP